MRGTNLLALASLSVCLLIASQPAHAQNVVTIPQFAEGFDGQSIWHTQMFIDGRTVGADQTVINIFGPQGQFLHRVGPGEFPFMAGFFRRALLFPFFGPIPIFGCFPCHGLPFQTGFFTIESAGSLNFTAVIQRFSVSGDLISELVISPFDAFHRANLVVDEMQARVLAFALTNTDTLKRALGRFDFFPLGSQEALFSFPFDIGPRSQFSSFLFDMFPQLASGRTERFHPDHVRHSDLAARCLAQRERNAAGADRD